MEGNAVDLWRDHGPAYGENGTKYSCDLYGDEALQIVEKHDFETTPIFMYLPMHDTHSPYEAPPRWLDPRITNPDHASRQLMQGMLTCTDSALGNLTAALRAKPGVWDNTLFVWSSDNGGPVTK